MRQSPAVIVHGLQMAQEAASLGLPVTLLSAEGAAAYAGVGWWQALVVATRQKHSQTDIADILDCGFAPGRALEALRAGHRYLILRTDPAIYADIAERTATLGGVLLAEAPPALDLAMHGARRRLPAWLAA